MNKANILIVEDDNATAKFIKLILTNDGYAVTGIATSGEKAIDIVVKAKPDLVLMDIKLRGKIDGIMAFNEIRKVVQIPVVFVSAYLDKKMIERAMLCNPSGYIVKPFHIKDLLHKVKSVLDWQRIHTGN